ncbi:MAG TPA: hypothetical protein VL400_07580 [Polyangiaceae bacterium]|nr:hypothetical protein [Polyangiaceae bacterium]
MPGAFRPGALGAFARPFVPGCALLASACVLPDYVSSSSGSGGSGGGSPVCETALTKNIGTSGTEEQANDLVSGPDDSTIVIGDFSGTIEYVAGQSLPSLGTDAFVMRVAKDGTPEWVVQLGGNGDQHASAIARTADGSFIVTGWFGSEIQGQGDPIAASGPVDSFVARVEADGTLAWLETFGGPNEDYAVDAMATTGGVVIAGHFRDTMTIEGEVLPDQTLSPPDTLFDLFVLKVGLDGTFTERAAFTKQGEAYASELAARPDGTFYLAGTYKGTMPFGGTDAGPDSTGYDMFVAKLSSTFSPVYSRRYGAGGDDSGGNIVATDDGYVVSGVSVSSTDPIDFGGAEVTPTDLVYSYFLARLDDGNAGAWARLLETATPGVDPKPAPTSLALRGSELVVALSVNAPIVVGSETLPDGTDDSADVVVLGMDLDTQSFVGRASWHAPAGQRLEEVVSDGCGLAFAGWFNGTLELPDAPKVEATGKNIVVGRLSETALFPP